MELATMKTLVMLVLGMHYWCASGFPVYDYDPSSLQEALSASVAKVNSQSLSPYLAFQRGYSVPTAACRSTVQMSKGQVKDVWAHCRWASTSESNSSEEGFLYDEPKGEQFYDRSIDSMKEREAEAEMKDMENCVFFL
ncbi:secreted phosphoprotein 2, isoform CRA_b [Rattus norvegicus]|uniref:Secreted phosphoprotein 2, isoform CRA_b n=1 Tax=Rattus norvegicus TaxID=10116 RepID=A6JQJ6_RAT|nr:secreted phosphoprotein 2, isoform CRA_b [Rattus norvegicus]